MCNDLKKKTKEVLQRINWNYGKGDLVKIEYREEGTGRVNRKMHYGEDERQYTINCIGINRFIIHFLGHQKSFKTVCTH